MVSMVVKCVICGNRDVDLKLRPFFTRSETRPYCSNDCRLIDNYHIYGPAGIVYLIFPPLGLYLIISAILGYSLKKKRAKQKALKKSLCFNCGKGVEITTIVKTVCMHCGEFIHFCDLCQKHILFNEDVLQIEPCGHIFHKAELLEWTDKNNVCPKCAVKIEFIDFQPD